MICQRGCFHIYEGTKMYHEVFLTHSVQWFDHAASWIYVCILYTYICFLIN